MRLCMTVQRNDTTSAELWIEDAWADKHGVRLLTEKRYNEWIVNSQKGDKPWLVAFGLTTLSQSQSQQTTNSMILKLNCLAQVFPEEAHYGFIDFKKGERIIESYDYEMQYGQMAPYLMYFKESTAYHLKSKNWSPKDIVEFMGNYTLESRYNEPVRRARNKVNLFLEYASKDIGNNRQLHQAYTYLRNNHNETWAFQNLIAPNF